VFELGVSRVDIAAFRSALVAKNLHLHNLASYQI
jgi:hypothetical protein